LGSVSIGQNSVTYERKQKNESIIEISAPQENTIHEVPIERSLGMKKNNIMVHFYDHWQQYFT